MKLDKEEGFSLLNKSKAVKDKTKEIVLSGEAEQAFGEKTSNKTKQKVLKNLDNPKKLNEIKNKEKPKSISDQFTGSLMHFLPLVVGSALGGLDTGVSAQEGANAFMQQSTENDRKERELKVKEQVAEQTLNGGPLTEFQKRSLKLREDTLGLELRAEGRRDKGLELGVDRFGFTKKQAEQLSEKQTEKFGNISATLDSLDRINELKQRVNTGPLAGRGQSIAETFGSASPEFTQLKAESENSVAQYIKAISGAQASDREVTRLKQVAATINDDDKTFENKMIAFQRIVEQSKAAIEQSIKSGQPLKKGTIDALIDQEFGSQQQSGREAVQQPLTPRQLRIQELRAKAGQ